MRTTSFLRLPGIFALKLGQNVKEESPKLMGQLVALRKELHKHANKEKARLLQRFFKTGKGEYAQGDIFLGVMVPVTRKVARQFADLPLEETRKLLHSKLHEERLLALLILIGKFNNSCIKEKKKIFKLYLSNARYINNWDLVDLSAPNIVGSFLLNADKAVLYKMADSRLLWDRRIAVLATFAFIRKGEFNHSFALAEKLLFDREDLMHKACGWMLREIGKRDQALLEQFLRKHRKNMPRTMLRYAIERFPENKRRSILARR